MSLLHEDVWLPRLSEYLDGDLSADDRQALERHVETCGTCAKTLSELHAVVRQLHDETRVALPATHLPALWPRLASRLTIQSPPAKLRAGRFWSPWPARLVAAGLLFVFGFAGGAWFGRAQCTGALPWSANQWVQASLAALGLRSGTAKRADVPVRDTKTDSLRNRANDSVQDSSRVPVGPR